MLIGETDAKDIPAHHETAFWLAMNQRSGHIPPSLLAEAVAQTGASLADLWSADRNILTHAGFNARAIDEFAKIRSSSALRDAEKIATECERRGIRIIRFGTNGYPKELGNFPSAVIPPLVLFHKGSLDDFSNCVAIVGTRDASFLGRSTARKVAKRLAGSGYTIVSGLARGTDVEVHMGALESKKGKTIAVLAWFDPIYPEEHSELIKEIERRGARISENYTKPFGSLTPGKFVERNRITSGISKFVVIVETGEDGGTMRQAELARRENVPIFVFAPRGSERATRGFTAIVEKHNGIPFRDIDDLMKKISENKLEPENNRLSQYSMDEQNKLT